MAIAYTIAAGVIGFWTAAATWLFTGTSFIEAIQIYFMIGIGGLLVPAGIAAARSLVRIVADAGSRSDVQPATIRTARG